MNGNLSKFQENLIHSPKPKTILSSLYDERLKKRQLSKLAPQIHMGLKESHHIGRVVIHPTGLDTVYVAAQGHLYSENPERGVYKTTYGGRGEGGVFLRTSVADSRVESIL